MRAPALIGFFGGIVIALLQAWAIHRSMHSNYDGTMDMLLHYSPQIVYFMCIYMSVKIYTRIQPNEVPEFKGCLKAGGVTMLIICLFWWIAIFVSITHTDVRAVVNFAIEHDQKANVPLILQNFSRQGMFDHAKWMTLPNFLLGFAMTVLVTVIFRLRGKKAV
jgi:hypothetical protein